MLRRHFLAAGLALAAFGSAFPALAQSKGPVIGVSAIEVAKLLEQIGSVHLGPEIAVERLMADMAQRDARTAALAPWQPLQPSRRNSRSPCAAMPSPSPCSSQRA